MADVTPVIPAGRQVIETYGENRFHVSGVRYVHSLLVLPEQVIEWAPVTWEEVDLASFQPLIDLQAADVLLLGSGRRAQLPSREIRQGLRDAGIVVEPMDTGAACRTYNVLMAEDRRVAAALLTVK